MKRVCIILVVLALAGCASPVLRKDVLDQGQTNVPFSQIAGNPSAYVGRLFILGGLIVSTRLVPGGSMIEALYIPVDRHGYLQEPERPGGRFLAFQPSEMGILDPAMYREGRRITIAGTFMETRTGTIGEMSYVFPFFRIEDVHLWDEFIQRPYPNTFFNFGLFGVIR
jgi:outer membrane lipoprotein